MIHAMNQKLTDVISSSIRWRRSGIRPGVRRGSVGVVTVSGYARPSREPSVRVMTTPPSGGSRIVGPRVVPHCGVTTMSATIREWRPRLAVTYGLVIVENTFELLYPFAIGLAVDGLLDDSWGGVVLFAVISLSHTAVSFTRQRQTTAARSPKCTSLMASEPGGASTNRGRRHEHHRRAGRTWPASTSKSPPSAFRRRSPPHSWCSGRS